MHQVKGEAQKQALFSLHSAQCQRGYTGSLLKYPCNLKQVTHFHMVEHMNVPRRPPFLSIRDKSWIKDKRSSGKIVVVRDAKKVERHRQHLQESNSSGSHHSRTKRSADRWAAAGRGWNCWIIARDGGRDAAQVFDLCIGRTTPSASRHLEWS